MLSFAGTGRTQQRNQFAGPYFQIDPVQGFERAESLGDIDDLNAHLISFCSCVSLKKYLIVKTYTSYTTYTNLYFLYILKSLNNYI